MKKPQRPYNLDLPADADYKTEWLYKRDKENFESTDKWIYLGADAKNPNYAKVGITMGDLVSRSYSSANPYFYLFCAFQCVQSTTKSQLEEIERSAHCYLDRVFTNRDGSTKRVHHFESGRISECYYDIDFNDFLQQFHGYLFDNHSRYFSCSGFEINGSIVGDYLRCEFNQHISLEQRNYYINMILR
ncbi:hypothetical protein H0251_05860 [Pectobacterium carotovorum]|uniref:hypothetical protein n=1 Tax=Pectobacterium carotovorum TaxID=554 RepID=UPI0015DE3810|nr:hypothetical protein [Pectobacterium carotovorum]MBA0179167.1 hypothetical protein [Pectobacterium carotovorum]